MNRLLLFIICYYLFIVLAYDSEVCELLFFWVKQTGRIPSDSLSVTFYLFNLFVNKKLLSLYTTTVISSCQQSIPGIYDCMQD